MDRKLESLLYTCAAIFAATFCLTVSIVMIGLVGSSLGLLTYPVNP